MVRVSEVVYEVVWANLETNGRVTRIGVGGKMERGCGCCRGIQWLRVRARRDGNDGYIIVRI